MKKLIFIVIINFLNLGIAQEIESMNCIQLLRSQKKNKRLLDLALRDRAILYSQEANEEKLEILNNLIDRYTIKDQKLILTIMDKNCLNKEKARPKKKS